MTSFELISFVGAAPVLFGMSCDEVYQVLGPPKSKGEDNSWRPRADSWGPRLEICVGYDANNKVNHVGFGPGEIDLAFRGSIVWKAGTLTDPNPLFLQYDPNPVERVGFLMFNSLGITTTGFHDDDPYQYAITVFQKGAKDKFSAKASVPNLQQYSQV